MERIDYVFSSPPFFKGAGSIFGNTPMQYLQRCSTWFSWLLDKTGASIALVHVAENHFTRITAKSISPINFVARQRPNASNKWMTIEQSDLLAVISRYFKNPNGKTLLDPFCGTGDFLVAAKSAGMNVIGVDLDGEQIKIASEVLGVKN